MTYMDFGDAGYTVGDFVLLRRRGFTGSCIRIGQAFRFRGKERPYARFTHAALIVSWHGDLVEALTRGVVRSHIDKYEHVPHTIVRTDACVVDQQQIVKFANRVVGEEYGWLTILCCAFGALTGGKFTVGYQGQAICSGLVARAQERAGAVFDRLAEDIVPADLARYYEVV